MPSLEELIYGKQWADKADDIVELFLLVRDDTSYVRRIATAVMFSAEDYDVPPDLLAAVIVVESYLDSAAVSVTGARGLMQIMPGWWLGVYPKCGDNLFVPETNVCYGAQILSWYIEYFDHRLLKALNGYSGGAVRYGAKVLTVLGALHLIETGEFRDEHGPHLIYYIPM